MITTDIKKYTVTALIMFVTVLIYSILKSVKDAVLISHMTAELISTTKLYGVLPSAIIFTIFYAKLSDYITRLNIYYLLNSFFISFFLIYTILIYPNANQLSPDLTNLKLQFPFFRYIFTMLEGWCYAIFYIMSELWGNVMIALMFWQFQNQINHINEAKKLYPIFIFIGEMGAVAGASIVTELHDVLMKHASWQELFNAITFTIVIASLLLALLIWFLSNKVLSRDIINKKHEIAPGDIHEASLIVKIKYILSSKIFRLITLLVICYGVSINFIEGVWKKYIDIVYETPEQIVYFMSQMEFYRGLSGFITTFIAVIILKKFSWKLNALVTPVSFIFLTLLFTFSIYNQSFTGYIASYLATSVMQVIVLVGAIQNIVTKATKYEFFEPAKEIAYISVDEELRTKGKAIVEVIGARLGKSTGSAIQWLLLSIFTGSNLLDLTPVLLILCIFVLIIWCYGTTLLAKEMKLDTYISQ